MDQPSLRRVDAESSAIEEAARHLRRGGLVAFPTETVYGLGANAARQGAVESLYRLKQRPADHPLIVHVAGVADASCWARLNPRALALIGALWPGPLTLVLARRPDSPNYACAGQKTIALRCPSHPVARALLGHFSALGGKGVAAPSANPYGRLSPTDADQVEEDLQAMMQAHALGRKRIQDPEIPDCWLIDGGTCAEGIESTVLDLSGDAPQVLRPGAIPRQQIEALLGLEVPWVRATEPALSRKDRGGAAGDRGSGASIRSGRPGSGTPSRERPKVSGTHLSHYAPRKPLILTDGPNLGAKLGELAAQGISAVAVWGDSADAAAKGGALGQASAMGVVSDAGFAHGLKIDQQSLPGSVQELAQQLYRQLRRMDQSEAEVLLVVLPMPLPQAGSASEEGAAGALSSPEWEAVLDRLQRAAYATSVGLVRVSAAPTAAAEAQPTRAKPEAMRQSFVRSGSAQQEPMDQETLEPMTTAVDDLDFDVSFDDLG